jgi:tRNA (mo5U34)-methyltransferase
VAGSPNSSETLQERVDRIRWWHTIDLGNGIVTPGLEGVTADKLRWIGLPDDLSGKTVLDVGAWDGYFSFECERRGARRVLATDSLMWRLESGNAGFLTAREALGSAVEDQEIDVLELAPEHLGGTFDVVLFLGVLYHMRDPMLALERAFSVTGERIVLETHVDLLDVPRAAMAFYPFDELAGDFSNWVGPNLLAVDGMLRATGFSEVLAYKPPSGRDADNGELIPIGPETTREIFGDAQSGRLGIHAFR